MPNATTYAPSPEAVQPLSHAQQVESALRLVLFKHGIWVFGIPSWLFGIADRSIASFADGYLSVVEIIQLLTLSFFFFGWLGLKPDEELTNSNAIALQNFQDDEGVLHPERLFAAQARMLELQSQHIASQSYVLPFPYLCQIYHLLNLKHLETVHSFSLSNLRVLSVSQVRSTQIGGHITFETILDSSMNILRMWRDAVVEVDLVLHTPYTVELSVPIYAGKRIIVLFNALPLAEGEHRFLIDIYSDLAWPKPLLQAVFNAAASLTLLEDMPYLHQLSETRASHLFHAKRGNEQNMMFLFRRFVELYGTGLESHQLPEGAVADPAGQVGADPQMAQISQMNSVSAECAKS
ncbi:MAG: hypothetical protein VKK04_18400 [Synechococcales bacterium]|nr:hypothetical protein [Synechococcales bacterium]